LQGADLGDFVFGVRHPARQHSHGVVVGAIKLYQVALDADFELPDTGLQLAVAEVLVELVWWSASPDGGPVSERQPGDLPAQGVIATFSTPSRWWPNSS
jgi:hypothetical protein